MYLKAGKNKESNIQVDLGMTTTEYGIVNGTAFTLINSGFGLIMGYLVDRVPSRRVMLLICTVMMNLLTAVCYFTHSFI